MIFLSKRKKIENLLRASRMDFRFDSDNVKTRVMMGVNARHLSHDDLKRLTFNVATWPKYMLSAGIASFALIAATSFTFAANQSRPGDILFPIQKLQNKVVLSLPLPQTTKAEISTGIVAKRLRELDEIQKNPNDIAKVNAEVREVQASIEQAVSYVPESDGDNKGITKIRTELNDLSSQHQEKLQSLSTQVEDNDLREEIQKSVTNIAAAKARLENTQKNKTIQGGTIKKSRVPTKTTKPTPENED